jgi:ribosomal protein L9
MKVRLLNQYRSYRRGDVVEVSARMADELVRQGLAVVETQGDFLQAERREAAVAARVNVRTADRK